MQCVYHYCSSKMCPQKKCLDGRSVWNIAGSNARRDEELQVTDCSPPTSHEVVNTLPCCLQPHTVCRIKLDHGCSQDDGKRPVFTKPFYWNNSSWWHPTGELAPPAVYLDKPTPYICIITVDGNVHWFTFFHRISQNSVKRYNWMEIQLLFKLCWFTHSSTVCSSLPERKWRLLSDTQCSHLSGSGTRPWGHCLPALSPSPVNWTAM